MQRFLDVVLASSALILLAPVFIPIAVILRLTGEGEVFYTQLRVGKGGGMFALYKFATMLKNSPNIGTGTVTLRNDPRVLPFGRFLRTTKLNELPQLLNVVFGDMSIVGPRPQTERCFSAFPESSKEAIKRIRPGLTGVGSIVFRDEERLMDLSGEPERFYDTVIMPYKGVLEEWYVKNRSLGLYFSCITLTMWVVVFPKSLAAWTLFRDLPPRPQELLM